jgi:Glycosyltransferases involved in cell wall biogenesis
MTAVLILLVVVGVGWLVAWWRLRGGRALRTVTVAEPSATVDVVVPARDEERRLPVLLEALTRQSYLAQRVIVVDDDSTDSTAALAAAAGASVVSAGPVPDGSTGRSWASWQGAQASTADLLVFLDADTEPGPGLLRQVTAEQARLGGLLVIEPLRRWTRPQDATLALLDLVVPGGVGVVCARRDYLAVAGHDMAGGLVSDAEALAARFVARGMGVHRRSGVGVLEVRSTGTGGARRLCAARRTMPRLTAAVVGLWVASMIVGCGLATVAATDGAWLVAALLYAIGAIQLGLISGPRGPLRWPIAVLYPVPLLGFMVALVWATAVCWRGSMPWKGRRAAFGSGAQ